MREDIADSLIHFTKANSELDAYSVLRKILREQLLIGSNNKIRSGDNCVCFSEVPVDSLKGGFTNSSGYSQYSRFGIVFPKNWIFEIGGRPVIYQSESEYKFLTEENKWRHMRLDLSEDKFVDFTWEREWRVKIESLSFSCEFVSIVLPNKNWEERFIADMNEESWWFAYSWTIALDDDAWWYDTGNPWHTVTPK